MDEMLKAEADECQPAANVAVKRTVLEVLDVAAVTPWRVTNLLVLRDELIARFALAAGRRREDPGKRHGVPPV